MTDKCRLYGVEEELRQSHILPKFIIDYFKSTGSRFIRGFSTPNKRRQDGIKRNYLSHQAEQDFSIREKWFAENFFRRFMDDGQRVFPYDENLYYFLISVLWRGLLHQLELPEIYGNPQLKVLNETEAEWRNYLVENKTPPRFSDVNLLLTDHIKTHDTGVTGLDYYFTRMIDFTILADDSGQCIYVYCKFLKFVVWATIRDVRPNINKELIISKNGGILRYPQSVPDTYMIQCLIKRAESIAAMPGPSDTQQDKIIEEIKKNPDTLYKSAVGAAIFNDWRLDQK